MMQRVVLRLLNQAKRLPKNPVRLRVVLSRTTQKSRRAVSGIIQKTFCLEKANPLCHLLQTKRQLRMGNQGLARVSRRAKRFGWATATLSPSMKMERLLRMRRSIKRLEIPVKTTRGKLRPHWPHPKRQRWNPTVLARKGMPRWISHPMLRRPTRPQMQTKKLREMLTERSKCLRM
jgi:hypothetical protein